MRDQTKTFWFSSRIAVMVVGAGDAMLAVLQSTYIEMNRQSEHHVEIVAETLGEQLRVHRQKAKEQRVLRQYGLTYQSFLQNQHSFAPTSLQRVLIELEDSSGDLGVQVIIAGVDSRGASLYALEYPGIVTPLNMGGFIAIGSGSSHAISVFISEQYTPYRPWNEDAVLTYFAKKRAEAAPGVGQHTDLYYLDYRGVRYFPPNDHFQMKLSELYTSKVMTDHLFLNDSAASVQSSFAPTAPASMLPVESSAGDEPPAGSWDGGNVGNQGIDIDELKSENSIGGDDIVHPGKVIFTE